MCWWLPVSRQPSTILRIDEIGCLSQACSSPNIILGIIHHKGACDKLRAQTISWTNFCPYMRCNSSTFRRYSCRTLQYVSYK